LVGEVGGDGLDEVVEEGALLQAAGFAGGEHAFDEAAARAL